ncbi:hypothetical protein NP493_30g06069 [Ridgeia piscesae]|uniref:Uncharacterized protein n=1 Tax=Ridgeia piscesae TaxID=27915 RepID=A0AAD9UK18_RIDPI|nr:hypothetical protein NP493_30g06069 [Ridgeia piscesae]
MQLKNTVARKLCKGSLLYSKGNINTIEFSGEGDSNECHASYYHCLLKQEMSRSTDQSDEKLQPYLEHWWTASTRYLGASVSTLGDNLKYLVYLALLDAELEVVCSDDQLKADIISFLDCCSLAELLSNLTVDRRTDSSPSLTDSIPVIINTSAQTAALPETVTPTVTLHIDGATCQISSHGEAKGDECNEFCEEWASALMTGDADNPEFIRQIIENYRLKAIQDMNTLKRLLRQAETDYYSLFRCSVFLGQCGNSAVLLRHATLESDSRDRGILSILHCHLQADSSKSS